MNVNSVDDLQARFAQLGAEGHLDADHLGQLAVHVPPSLANDFQRMLEATTLAPRETAALVALVPTERADGLKVPDSQSLIDMATNMRSLTSRYSSGVEDYRMNAILKIEDPVVRGSLLQILRQISDGVHPSKDDYALRESHDGSTRNGIWVAGSEMNTAQEALANLANIVLTGSWNIDFAHDDMAEAWEAMSPAERTAADEYAKRAVVRFNEAVDVLRSEEPGVVDRVRDIVEATPALDLEMVRAIYLGALFDAEKTIDGESVYRNTSALEDRDAAAMLEVLGVRAGNLSRD